MLSLLCAVLRKCAFLLRSDRPYRPPRRDGRNRRNGSDRSYRADRRDGTDGSNRADRSDRPDGSDRTYRSHGRNGSHRASNIREKEKSSQNHSERQTATHRRVAVIF